MKINKIIYKITSIIKIKKIKFICINKIKTNQSMKHEHKNLFKCQLQKNKRLSCQVLYKIQQYLNQETLFIMKKIPQYP